MRAQFQQQQAERHAVVQAQENARQAELNGLKQELATSKQQVSSLQNSSNNSVSSYQNKISNLKSENQKLHNTINQQKTHIAALLQNNKDIQHYEKTNVEQLEKSLIEKTKDLSLKDGIISGLTAAIQLISNAPANNLAVPKVNESGLNGDLQGINLILDIDDILTEQSQIVDNNPQSMLLGEMFNSSTIQVSEEDL